LIVINIHRGIEARYWSHPLEQQRRAIDTGTTDTATATTVHTGTTEQYRSHKTATGSTGATDTGAASDRGRSWTRLLEFEQQDLEPQERQLLPEPLVRCEHPILPADKRQLLDKEPTGDSYYYQSLRTTASGAYERQLLELTSAILLERGATGAAERSNR